MKVTDRQLMRVAEQAELAAKDFFVRLKHGERFYGLERDNGSVYAVFDEEMVCVDPLRNFLSLLHSAAEDRRNPRQIVFSVLSMGDDVAFTQEGHVFDVTGYFGEDMRILENPTDEEKMSSSHIRLESAQHPGAVWRMVRETMVADLVFQ